MSEVVVRMEMPTENTTCELNCYSNFYREWRCIIKDKRCDHNKNGMFPSWCPIICPLPEGHGRLVDADAMEEDLDFDVENDQRALDDMDIVGYERTRLQFDKDCKKKIMWYLSEAPTIVPAEAERSET